MCDFLKNNTLGCEEPARIVGVKLARIVNVVLQSCECSNTTTRGIIQVNSFELLGVCLPRSAVLKFSKIN